VTFIDSDALLVTDFVNLKIKPAQSFRYIYRGRVCVRVFIRMSANTCMSIRIRTVFLKNRDRILYRKEKVINPPVGFPTLTMESMLCSLHCGGSVK
jgi:hypothetical protein